MGDSIMNKGKTFFVLLMGMIATLYTAFVVIGQDAPAAGESAGEAAVTAAPEAPAEPAAVPAESAAPVTEEAVAQPTQEVTVVEAPASATPDATAPESAAVPEATTPEAPAAPDAAAPEAPAAGEGAEEVAPVEDGGVFVSVTEDEGTIPGASAQKQDEQGTISISLDDVEMADVVRMFTRISGANIIASPSNLVGRVTANLDDVHWQSAMETILDMHSLALTESPPGSKIFRIDPKVPGAPEPMKVKTFFLKYAQVSNTTAVISSMLSPGATMQPFASRNALVIRSTAGNLGEIQEVVDAIDKIRDQVFIEAKFMELNDSAIKDLGINWQVLQGYNVGVGSLAWNVNEQRNWDESTEDTLNLNEARARQESVVKAFSEKNDESVSESLMNPDVLTTTLAGTTPTYTLADIKDTTSEKGHQASDSFSKAITDVRTAVLGVDDFRLVLSALKQMDGVQVVSNPKIIVANEEPAIIHIGQEQRPFESTVTPATQTTAPIVTYNPGAPVQLGVKLRVVPTINTESNITVRIAPELTRFIGDDTAPNGQTYPIIAKKTIETQFCLESGKTVAIGGLTETVEQDNTKKIPLLGDIPLIGKYLFSHSHKEKSQQETVIFVTVGIARPESVQEMDGLPDDTELAHHKLLEKKLKRYNLNADLEKEREKVEAQLQESERVRSQLMRSK